MKAIPRRLGSRGQRGETLIEMLFTMFIMGTVLLSLLGLLMTIVVSSATHRATVSAGNQATTVAENLDKVAYVPCGGGGNPLLSYKSKVGSPAPGYAADLVTVEYLSDGTSSTPSFVSSCPGTGDKGTQRLTVKVRQTSAPGASAEVKLVKRNQACPAGMGAQLLPGQKC